jgi:hypothetical protein
METDIKAAAKKMVKGRHRERTRRMDDISNMPCSASRILAIISRCNITAIKKPIKLLAIEANPDRTITPHLPSKI